MTAPIPEPPNLDDLIKRHFAGEGANHLCREIGVSSVVFVRWLKKRGLKLRPRAIPAPADIETLVSRYQQGMPVTEICRERGVEQSVVFRWLRERGVEPRGQAEAMAVRWKRIKASPDREAETKRLCGKAWKAASERVVTWDERVARAKTVINRARVVGINERELMAELESRGVRVRWQHAVGAYNLDLALKEDRIAVEVQREASSPESKPRSHSLRPKRLEYLLNRGWALFVIRCPPGWKWSGDKTIPGTRYERFDPRAVADKLIAFRDVIRRQPSPRGQYGMISGYAEPVTMRGVDLDKWSRVPGF